MSLLSKLLDWILYEPEPAGEPDPRKRRKRPPTTKPGEVQDPGVLAGQVNEALTELYGAPARTFPVGEPAVTAVEVYLATDPRQAIYVTRGLHRWRHPHEHTLRLRISDGPAGDAFDPPQWPVTLLAALGARTLERDKATGFGERITHLDVAGVAYHHVIIVPDADLDTVDDLGDDKEALAFVQAVPLLDDQLTAMDAIPKGERNTVLAEWSAQDRCLRVGDL